MHNDAIGLFDLSGKVAMIIGGARLLGYDMACALGSAGADLVITSRDISRSEKSAKVLSEKYGIDVLPLQLDHTDYQQVVQAARTASEWKGRIDILVNNAGGGSIAKEAYRLLQRSPEAIVSVITNNLIGTMYCCKEVGKIMADQGYGKIINISSISGVVGRDHRMYDRSNMQGQSTDYAAAKAGLIGMTLDMAAYLGPMGVRVNCISPGGFDNHHDLPQSFVKDYSDRTPLGRMGQEDSDIKGATLFLSSPASDYITGQNIMVDGGFSIWQ